MRKEAPRRRISLRTHGWHALNLISRNKRRTGSRWGRRSLAAWPHFHARRFGFPIAAWLLCVKNRSARANGEESNYALNHRTRRANPRATAAFRALAYTERHFDFQIRSGCGPMVTHRSARHRSFDSAAYSARPQPEREHRSGRMGRMSSGFVPLPAFTWVLPQLLAPLVVLVRFRSGLRSILCAALGSNVLVPSFLKISHRFAR